jgi:hypothetical protein
MIFVCADVLDNDFLYGRSIIYPVIKFESLLRLLVWIGTESKVFCQQTTTSIAVSNLGPNILSAIFLALPSTALLGDWYVCHQATFLFQFFFGMII